jgi:hypothetical protein
MFHLVAPEPEENRRKFGIKAASRLFEMRRRDRNPIV